MKYWGELSNEMLIEKFGVSAQKADNSHNVFYSGKTLPNLMDGRYHFIAMFHDKNFNLITIQISTILQDDIDEIEDFDPTESNGLSNHLSLSLNEATELTQIFLDSSKSLASDSISGLGRIFVKVDPDNLPFFRDKYEINYNEAEYFTIDTQSSVYLKLSTAKDPVQRETLTLSIINLENVFIPEEKTDYWTLSQGAIGKITLNQKGLESLSKIIIEFINEKFS